MDEARVVSALRHESKLNFDLYLKKNQFLCLYVVVLVKTFPLLYHLLL